MNELYKRLSDAILDMDEDAAREVSLDIISEGLSAAEAIQLGVVDGMSRAGEFYDREEYFISELLSCSDAMWTALAVLKPALGDEAIPSKGRIVIGTVEGDTHDIGKNIVSLILEGGGFTVLDLGRDVSATRFVESALEFGADIIALSSLMTTTMENMRDVISLLRERELRERFRVIVGGRPVTAAFARDIGADGYSSCATGALRLCEELMLSINNKSNDATIIIGQASQYPQCDI